MLTPDEYNSRLVAADPESTAALPDGAGLVVLDGTVTAELEAEAGPKIASANCKSCVSRPGWTFPTASGW